jgi:transcriptional regulator with XRE-family HTH domain
MNYEIYKITFGKMVREKRIELGYSQESFAEVAELHRTYIGAIERGERNLSLKNLIKIANTLKCSPSEMFSIVETNLKAE